MTGELTVEQARALAKARHSELTAMVKSCIDLTQAEVLAAGASLETIVAEGESQLSELSSLRDQFEVDSSDDSQFGMVVGRVRRLLTEVKRLVLDITTASTNIEQQAKEVDRGARDLVPLVGTMRDVARNARLLAFNARIEAARGASDEQTLVALAEEMNALAHKSRESASLIEGLSDILREYLPQMSKSIHSISDRCVRSSLELQDGDGSLQDSYGEATASLEAAVTSARERSSRVQEEYYALLEKLQFQDRVSQTLELADRHIRCVERFVDRVLVASESCEPSSPLRLEIMEAAKELDTAFLEDRCRPALPGQKAEDDGTVASGDMLFL